MRAQCLGRKGGALLKLTSWVASVRKNRYAVKIGSSGKLARVHMFLVLPTCTHDVGADRYSNNSRVCVLPLVTINKPEEAGGKTVVFAMNWDTCCTMTNAFCLCPRE